jgi:putative FmdB family regulatory protein
VPIYEYVCEACGRITECMQRVSDPPPPGCPECGAARLARLVSRTTFQLKGGGWYSDLYSSPKQKPAPAADSGKPAPAADAGKPAGGGSAPAAAGSSTASAPGAAPAKSSGTGGSGSGST